jgi:hypothetical protein
MRLVLKMLNRLSSILRNNLNYFYVNSILKKDFSDNLILKNNEKILIGIIDNISHVPTFVTLEFLIYLKSLNHKNNYIFILPFGKKIKTMYRKNEKFVKDSDSFRVKTILHPILEIVSGFNKNIFFFSNRFDAYNLIKNSKNIVLIPKNSNILNVTRYDFRNSFFKKYLLNYIKTKKRVLLKSPEPFLDFIKKYIDLKYNQKIVTISLKDANYSPARSSKIYEWLKFASFLKSRKIRVIFILDITSMGKKNYLRNLFGNYEIYDLFSFDIRARLAIYELSYLNCTIGSGTNVLLINSKSSYLLFSPIKEEIKYGTGSYDLWFKHVGVPIYEQFPFASKKQKIVWSKNNERFSIMVKEFLNFEKINN